MLYKFDIFILKGHICSDMHVGVYWSLISRKPITHVQVHQK